jgi:hypothetical protein
MSILPSDQLASNGTPREDEYARLLRLPGEHDIQVPIVCVMSRFGLRKARHLRVVKRDYEHVTDEIGQSGTPGFLYSAFLVESPRIFHTISFWRDRGAIPQFGTRVPRHVHVARRLFDRVAYDEQAGPEVWSTKWQLIAVSNNLNWGDFDLRREIADHHARQEQSARP